MEVPTNGGFYCLLEWRQAILEAEKRMDELLRWLQLK